MEKKWIEKSNPLEFIEKTRNLTAVNAFLRKAGAHKDKRDKRKSNVERRIIRDAEEGER